MVIFIDQWLICGDDSDIAMAKIDGIEIDTTNRSSVGNEFGVGFKEHKTPKTEFSPEKYIN